MLLDLASINIYLPSCNLNYEYSCDFLSYLDQVCSLLAPKSRSKTSWGEVMLALGKLMKNDFVLLKLIAQTF